MKKQIVLQNKSVAYTLRKSKRARRMRLAVYCDGAVVVTTPYDLQESTVERFIQEKTKWLFSKITFFAQFKGLSVARYSKKDYRENKDRAYDFAVRRIEHFNSMYQFRVGKINVRNQKTRWGSCSRKGNLNFNYKIALLPQQLSDYIIVHELCHLKEFNHSRKFWNLVAKIFPDYRDIRGELKKSGLFLR